MLSDGLMHYQKVDLPMGEFWLNSPTHDKPNDMLDAISGAHIYGDVYKRQVLIKVYVFAVWGHSMHRKNLCLSLTEYR